MPSGNNGFDTTDHGSPGMNRRKWLAALGMAGTAGLAGCQGSDSPQDSTTATTTDDVNFGEGTTQGTTTEGGELPEVGGTYTQAVSSSFDSLNLIYNTEDTTGNHIMYTLDSSYTFKPGQKMFPRWLELTTDDKRVYTAKLRENLHWSEPYGQLTAEDYVYLIKKVHQTDWAGSADKSYWHTDDGKPIPVEKTGKYSFEIRLPEVDPAYPKRPNMWATLTAPKKLIKPYVDKQDAKGLKQDKELNNLSFTGNLGPYKLKEWQRQKKMVFERNDEYYLREADDVKDAFSKAPYFDTLETQIIKESSSRLSALKTGEIDDAQIPPNKASNFKQQKDVYLNVSPQPYNVPLFYNQRANGWKPFRKQGVRQALGCAIDKKKFVKGVFRNYAEPEFTWQPKWSPWYDDSKVVKYGVGDLYGPEATRSRMEKALKDTEYSYDGDTLVDGNGEQVELTLMYQSSQQTEVATAQFVKQEFAKNAGIKVKLNGVGATKFVRDYWQNQVPENADQFEWSHGAYNAGPRDKATSKKGWDMARVYGLNTYPMTPTTNEVFFKKDGTYNPYGYYPTYDFGKLFNEAKKETDPKKRKEILSEIFGKLSKDQPMGMLALNSDIYGYRNGIEGPIENFFNEWDFSTWHRSSDSQ
ncbi:ABC transporter substrate-binding protein [Halorussus sp. AFM4]|uniref:ABC transporter substrate-binding protein n=1 Tax=Halorussus sp. AFM4 TaxID=3421651 RepID=UPI003EBCB232